MHPVAPFVTADKAAVRSGKKDVAGRLQVVIHQAPVVEMDVPLWRNDQAARHLLGDVLRDRPDLRLYEVVPFIPLKLPDPEEERRDADHRSDSALVQLHRILEGKIRQRQRPDLLHLELLGRDQPRFPGRSWFHIAVQQLLSAFRRCEFLRQGIHLHNDARLPFRRHEGIFRFLGLLQIVRNVL